MADMRKPELTDENRALIERHLGPSSAKVASLAGGMIGVGGEELNRFLDAARAALQQDGEG